VKYTPSRDGKLRVTLSVQLRLTKEEYAKVREEARASKNSVHRLLRAAAYGGVWDLLYPDSEEREEEYPHD
jgi:hypothetical protein